MKKYTRERIMIEGAVNEIARSPDLQFFFQLFCTDCGWAASAPDNAEEFQRWAGRRDAVLWLQAAFQETAPTLFEELQLSRAKYVQEHYAAAKRQGEEDSDGD